MRDTAGLTVGGGARTLATPDAADGIVKAHVIASAQDLKVLGAVVGLGPVLVMDVLQAIDGPTNDRLGNEDMFADIAGVVGTMMARTQDMDVALVVNVAPALPAATVLAAVLVRALAGPRAVEAEATASVGFLGVEASAASDTGPVGRFAGSFLGGSTLATSGAVHRPDRAGDATRGRVEASRALRAGSIQATMLWGHSNKYSDSEAMRP